jgi:hypothetical protein
MYCGEDEAVEAICTLADRNHRWHVISRQDFDWSFDLKDHSTDRITKRASQLYRARLNVSNQQNSTP